MAFRVQCEQLELSYMLRPIAARSDLGEFDAGMPLLLMVCTAYNCGLLPLADQAWYAWKHPARYPRGVQRRSEAAVRREGAETLGGVGVPGEKIGGIGLSEGL